MLNRYYIVDDFFTNPDQIVEAAIESVQGQAPGGNYAGLTTAQAFLGERERDIFQAVTQEQSINSSTDANGKIRFTRPQDSFKQYIHFDASTKTKWAGVVYLSKDYPAAIDGTTFWKHLRTGLEEVPKTREGLDKYGWKTKEDLGNFLETEGVDESLWEKTFTLPFKYNRLVLFRPWMFHAPGPAFGDTLDACRKVQTLFLGN